MRPATRHAEATMTRAQQDEDIPADRRDKKARFVVIWAAVSETTAQVDGRRSGSGSGGCARALIVLSYRIAVVGCGDR